MTEQSDRRRFYLWTTLGNLLEKLPVQFAVRVAQGAGWLVALRATPTRGVVSDNLRAIIEAGSTTPVDEAVLKRWVRRSYASYARYWAEGATLPALNPGIAHSRIAFIDGEQRLRAAMEQGKGVIIALPHIGSWEWGGALVAKIGYPMTAVAEQLEPPEMFEYFVEKREAVGLSILPLDKNAGKRLIATLRDGGLVGLLCDRDLAGDGIAVSLLGRSARVPAGPATLALRTGAVLLAGVAYSGDGNQHAVYISEPIDTERSSNLRSDVHRVTQSLMDEISSLIQRAPEQWHVFVPGFVDESEAP